MKSTSLRKSTIALAVMTAFCAAGAASAASSALISVAHPTYMRAGDAVMGALPVSQKIHFAMSLAMRDRAGLDAYIANMKNHPGQVMSTVEFNAKHAPLQAQVDAVTRWMKVQGFTNISVAPNHLLVSADGTAASVNRAFNTTMALVKTHDGRMAFGNQTEARIPAALQPHVLGVVGLQTVNIGHTFAKRVDPKAVHTLAVTGHKPMEFGPIYGGTGVATAAGVTVGIFTQGSMTTTISDLNKFTAGNGLATVTTQLVNTDGTGTSTSGVDEWDLDSQDIVGMGGGAVGKIIWYQTPSLSDVDMNDNFNTIVSANVAKIINVSIGGCETSAKGATQTTSDQAFAQGVAQGQTFSISTGDSGADECGNGGKTPSWPANSQYVMAVSGTTLNASTTTWSSETVWTSSGGSPSKFEPKPSWQNSTICPGSFRCVADVAFDGDPNSGAQLYLNGASPSSSTQVGGTSLSAPLFAGEWARVIASKGTSVGFAAPIIYGLPSSAFHDITSGSNGEAAKVGFDLATGWGSIILSNMVADIGACTSNCTTPTANFSDSISGQVVTFTDSSSDVGGTITGHSWTFGDGATSTATSPSHTYAAAGTYSVTETVTDSGGKTASKTVSVTVGGTGGTPTANFTDTVSGLTATFTDTSTDSGGTIGSHSWTFGDGSTSTATSPSHTYAAAGTYSVTETVTDSGNGHTSAKTASVSVGTISSQLLLNTGFESTASWTASSGVICATGCSGESAHAGAGFAWLDGYGSAHTDTLSQTVTVPSGKTSGTLQYYLHIDTAETTTSTAYDKLTVALYSGSTLVRTITTYSNLNKNTGYTVHTNALTSSDLAHPSLTLKFTGAEDSSLQTSFVLDDVTLTTN